MSELEDEYTSKALDHWKKWRPKMYREMKKAGTLNQHAEDAGKRASWQVTQLMAAGAQKHEAEEIVLPEDILVPPEKNR